MYRKRASSYAPSRFTKRVRASAPRASRALVAKKSTIAAPVRARVELKRAITDVFNSVTLTTNGIVAPFPTVAAGDENDQRDGRVIQIKGYELRVIYRPPPTADGSNFRIVIFKWNQSRDDMPQASDILENVVLPRILGCYNVNTASNYTILSDKVYNCDAYTKNIANTAFASRQIYIKDERNVTFNQSYADNTAGTVQDNSLFVLVVAEEPGGEIIGTGAVTYVDI